MSHLSRSLTLALTLATLASACAAQVPAVKPDPEVKAKLAELKKLVADRKGTKDAAATVLISDLEVKFATMHPKDQLAYARGLGEILNKSSIKRKPVQDHIYRTTILALGRAGKFGSPSLAKAFKNKKKYKDKEWVNLKGEMLEHLGRTKDVKQIKFLLDVALKDINDTLMAKAGGALRHFAGEKLKVRKEVAKLLIKRFAQTYDNANKNLDSGDLVVARWKSTLRAISEPWNATLQKLTKQHIRGAEKWNRFWNKRKGANWDKPLKKTRR